MNVTITATGFEKANTARDPLTGGLPVKTLPVIVEKATIIYAPANAGAALDDAVIYSSGSIARQSQPKVSFDLTSKKFMVVWVHSSGFTTPGGKVYSQIYGSAVTVNPATKTFSKTAAVSVTPDPDGLYYTFQSDPEIVFNPKLGKFVVSWLDTSAADGNRLINSVTVRSMEGRRRYFSN